ncbi:MAG: hypothetical protein M1132_14105 [Chloroflexi bacterium]|nr:hypothetical protein [Chloroflexota bacterium]
MREAKTADTAFKTRLAFAELARCHLPPAFCPHPFPVLDRRPTITVRLPKKTAKKSKASSPIRTAGRTTDVDGADGGGTTGLDSRAPGDGVAVAGAGVAVGGTAGLVGVCVGSGGAAVGTAPKVRGPGRVGDPFSVALLALAVRSPLPPGIGA